MSGDYSRDTFDALKDFAGVYLQQGRALLDADLNELGAILERRIRAGTVDTIGRCVVPRETEDGFAISIVGGDLRIGAGALYLDGMRLQNHGSADFDGTRPDRPAPVFDRGTFVDGRAVGVLDEMIVPPGTDPLSYFDQPYWRTPADLPGANATHLAYVVAWQREVTPVKDPRLLEPAMGGIDTCTRWQTVWQVRMLADVGDNATCATPDADLNGWVAEMAPSTARLTTATVQVDDPEDPCLVPPTDGYTGVENQLYRVELHATEDGAPPTAFKFSRENASVAARVDAIGAGNDRVTVTRIGRDEILRFSPGDWVELTDNRREFNHRSGQLLRVETVNPDTREIVFEPGSAIDGDLLPGGGDDTLEARATRLVRWDQRGIIRRADDLSEWTDVGADGSDGLIPIPPAGVALLLESGITVEFSTADGPGAFRDMDHWCFAARTAGTQIEELRAAPPKGIQRHYCKLAIVRFPGSVQDCRIFWPPEFEATETEGCACTVCVTAEGHNSGALTIQAAIDQVEAAGGTVCLEAGNYLLTTPVAIRNRVAIRLVGQGLGTILFWQGGGGAIEVDSSFDVMLERFTIVAAAGEDANGNDLTPHGVTAENSGFVSLERLAVLVVDGAPSDSFAFGVALDGMQIGAVIEDCLIFAPHAIGSRSSYDIDVDDWPSFVALLELRVRDSMLFGLRDAVRFDLVALNLAEAVFADNAVLGVQTGVNLRLLEIPGAATRVEGSTVIGGGDAIRLGCQDGRVTDCQLSGGDQGDGIRLIAAQIPDVTTEAQIIGNAILDCGGAGIRLAGLHESVLIKRNIIRDCGQGGVMTDPGAEVAHIAVDNNVIEDIAAATGAVQAGGVVILSADEAMVVGNGIRRVGQGGQSGGRFAGIAGQDVRSLRISGNMIDAIGPNLSEAPSSGIFVRQPYDDLIVSENQIRAEAPDGDAGLGNWMALDIGGGRQGRGDDGAALGPEVLGAVTEVPVSDSGGALADLAYLRFEADVVRLSAESLRATPRNRGGQVGLTGNQVRAEGRMTRAVVQAFDAGISALSFAQNQVAHRGGGGPPAAVELGALRMSVQGNTVQHQSDSISVDMTTGGQAAATPIGNITTNRMQLNGGAIPAPFAALNLIN